MADRSAEKAPMAGMTKAYAVSAVKAKASDPVSSGERGGTAASLDAGQEDQRREADQEHGHAVEDAGERHHAEQDQVLDAVRQQGVERGGILVPCKVAEVVEKECLHRAGGEGRSEDGAVQQVHRYKREDEAREHPQGVGRGGAEMVPRTRPRDAVPAPKYGGERHDEDHGSVAERIRQADAGKSDAVGEPTLA